MRIHWPLLFLVAAPCGGCATHYRVRFNDGNSVVVRGKPRFDKAENRYYLKDASGREIGVSAGRIVEIAPVSMSSRDSSSFLPAGSK